LTGRQGQVEKREWRFIIQQLHRVDLGKVENLEQLLRNLRRASREKDSLTE
jgi:hypothetical protein